MCIRDRAIAEGCTGAGVLEYNQGAGRSCPLDESGGSGTGPGPYGCPANSPAVTRSCVGIRLRTARACLASCQTADACSGWRAGHVGRARRTRLRSGTNLAGSHSSCLTRPGNGPSSQPVGSPIGLLAGCPSVTIESPRQPFGQGDQGIRSRSAPTKAITTGATPDVHSSPASARSGLRTGCNIPLIDASIETIRLCDERKL